MVVAGDGGRKRLEAVWGMMPRWSWLSSLAWPGLALSRLALSPGLALLPRLGCLGWPLALSPRLVCLGSLVGPGLAPWAGLALSPRLAWLCRLAWLVSLSRGSVAWPGLAWLGSVAWPGPARSLPAVSGCRPWLVSGSLFLPPGCLPKMA